MIQKLDPFVADKIAAGEVIEKPLSVVKELVENSIDGGANRITVEIRQGGKSYIRVTDNGTGIPAEEGELAFERHATGKIRTMTDLDSIETLGFRGEALASICAVSRMTMFTRTRDEAAGLKLELHGGRVVTKEPFAMSPGTSMIVEDLFYNTPARRKFMKSDAAEAKPIITLIQEMAIYYASISFTLINNGSEIMNTDGRGNRFSAVNLIYKSKEYKNLIEINGKYVNGYISGPGVTKSTRRSQIFFVNGRIIHSDFIEKALMEGYGDRVFSGYPIAVLFLTIPPEDLDVNIHPSKREVKFYDQKDLRSDIITAVRSTLDSINSIPEVMESKKTSASQELHENPLNNLFSTLKTGDEQENKPEPISTSQISLNLNGGSETDVDNDLGPEGEEKAEEDVKNSDLSAHNLRQFLEKMPSPEERKRNRNEGPATTVQSQSGDIITGISEDGEFDIEPPSIRPFNFNELQIKGYLFDSYIVTQTGDAVYLLDQHAAHERINYERLVKAYRQTRNLPQSILVPFSIETSADLYNADRTWMDDLQKMGFDIEDFGSDTFIVRGIPPYMTLSEARTFAESYLEELGQLKKGNRIVIDKLIMKSCKMSVKANDRLSPQEMEKLLDQLAGCINPFSCPHGRPTFISFTRSDIERWFRRK